jgi:hypothetical protein
MRPQYTHNNTTQQTKKLSKMLSKLSRKQKS